jgi:hypothetical protein
VAGDLDFHSDQAIYDTPATVDVGAFHDDGVIYLGVEDGGVVSDACVWAYVCVGADGAVFADDGGASYGGPAVDDGASSAIHAYSTLTLRSLRSPPPSSVV